MAWCKLVNFDPVRVKAFERNYEVTFRSGPVKLAVARKTAPLDEAEKYAQLVGHPLLMPLWPGAYSLVRDPAPRSFSADGEQAAIAQAIALLSA